MNETRWWVARNKQKTGPYSWSHMRQMADSGNLRPTDMVLQEGSGRWLAADAVPSLFEVPEVILDPDPEVPVAIPVLREVGKRKGHHEPEPLPRKADYARGARGAESTAGKCPGTVTTAGVIWIIVGAMILINLVVILTSRFAFSDPASEEVRATAGVLVALFLGFVGGVFIHVGVQSIRGTAKDTLGNGIGSMIFGVLEVVSAFTQEGQLGKAVHIATALLFAATFFIAGIFALIGRTEYKAWRRRLKAMRAQEDEY